MQKIISIFLLFIVLFLSSCSTGKKISKKQISSKLAEKLDITVNKKDDLRLYAETAKWLGTPYRYGGNTRDGVDCSGFVCNIYKDVYGIKLQRTVESMYKTNCSKISRNQLKPGDLVFFNTAKTKKSLSHVGIFLKDDTFIHATTSSGVRTSKLSEKYYKQRWINGGKVKK